MNSIDKLILNLDQALRTLVPGTTVAERANPAAAQASTRMDDSAVTHAAGLMRINHTGEICA
jgi:ubiquinone biosynthesis monooxygenase Coq7